MADTPSDVIFKREIAHGHRYAGWVRRRFARCGVMVEQPALCVRPERRDWPQYSDSGDLFLDTPTQRLVIEVKSRRLRFTDDPASYPWPTVFVDSVSTWDAKAYLPVAIVYVSQVTGGCLVLSVRRTREAWTRRETYDNLRDECRWRYEVDRGRLGEFSELCAWLWSQSLVPPTGFEPAHTAG